MRPIPNSLSLSRRRVLLAGAEKARVVVLGDVMLDQFLWGRVARISPEAPVPVVEFENESFFPGGAGNIARNVTSLGAHCELLGAVGRDDEARRLKKILTDEGVDGADLLPFAGRATSLKTRIIAHRQQVVRVDRESRGSLDARATTRLLAALERHLAAADAVIIGDYAKGVVTQALVDGARELCRDRGIWLSVDPKPANRLNLRGVSLLTPNRKEAFELAQISDGSHGAPMRDAALHAVAAKLMSDLTPALLLITLGDYGMLLCQRNQEPLHLPTLAREVFDVSGAGDTVIAAFTLAIVAGASPAEAAIFSNQAAGVVVGKLGTATVSPQELLDLR
jgi:D-beta-D-heptose 7-phosphate kinase/D-beta-D-heptose 1-phosphate adenosyltransferase